MSRKNILRLALLADIMFFTFLMIVAIGFGVWWANHNDMGEIQCMDYCDGPYHYENEQYPPLDPEDESFLCECK